MSNIEKAITIKEEAVVEGEATTTRTIIVTTIITEEATKISIITKAPQATEDITMYRSKSKALQEEAARKRCE
jgi:hypothetical protein